MVLCVSGAEILVTDETVISCKIVLLSGANMPGALVVPTGASTIISCPSSVIFNVVLCITTSAVNPFKLSSPAPPPITLPMPFTIVKVTSSPCTKPGAKLVPSGVIAAHAALKLGGVPNGGVFTVIHNCPAYVTSVCKVLKIKL